MRALLIEDDESTRRSVELLLRSEGYACVPVESGEEGLTLGLKGDFDVILLDLMLADLDGYTVLQRLREARITTPVLILSGLGEPDDKIKGLGFGADDYLAKPFDRRELIARVRAVVRRAKGFLPPAEAASLTDALLVRKGSAAPWSFEMAYAPASARRGSDAAGAHDVGRSFGLVAGAAKAPAAPFAAERRCEPPARPPAASFRGADESRGRVILLGSMKGGTGKSTTAMHLIVALLLAGRSLASLDLDGRQGSLSRYLENRRRHAAGRGRPLPLPEHRSLAAQDASPATLDEILASLAANHEAVVVDTPGTDSPAMRHAHCWADTLVTPINDSLMDLDALMLLDPETLQPGEPGPYGRIVAGARAARREAGAAPTDWILLRNRLGSLDTRNKRTMAAALDRLAGRLGCRLGGGISERVIYRELFLSGLTLLDLGERRSGVALSFSELAARQEIRGLLESLKLPGARPVRSPPLRRPSAAAPLPAAAGGA